MVTALVKRWTRKDYEKVIDTGIFAPGERSELNLEAVAMMGSQRSPHSTSANGEPRSKPLHIRLSASARGGT